MAAPMNGDTVKDSELVPDEQPVLRGENEGTADSMAADTVEAERARCLEESFPIFSDEEGTEEDAPVRGFTSRLSALEELPRLLVGSGLGGAGRDGEAEVSIKEEWITGKLTEIMETKLKLEQLAEAYDKKRRDLDTALEDMRHLAEVKVQLTARVSELSEQVLQARRLQVISEQVWEPVPRYAEEVRAKRDGPKPCPPNVPPPMRLLRRRDEMEATGESRNEAASSSKGLGPPTLLEKVARRPPPPARWLADEQRWVSLESEDDEVGQPRGGSARTNVHPKSKATDLPDQGQTAKQRKCDKVKPDDEF